MTISRRFTLAPAFARLIRRERMATPIVEGHFPDQSERRSFVRLEGEKCVLVLEDRNNEGSTEEERSEVSRAQGEVLLDVCAGKASYERISLEAPNGIAIHIDRFTAPVLASYIEVGFPDDAAAQGFRPPIWFGAELGPDDVGSPRRIALGGKPKLFEGAVQNAAIEALLDLLDQRGGRFGAYRGADDPMMHALRRLVKHPSADVAKNEPPSAGAAGSVEDEDLVFDPGKRNPTQEPGPDEAVDRPVVRRTNAPGQK